MMTTVQSNENKNTIYVSGDTAKYYGDLAKQYRDECQNFAQQTTQNVQAINNKIDEVASIANDSIVNISNLQTSIINSIDNHANVAISTIQSEASNKVTKTGDTMTGALKIEMVTPHQVFKSTNMTINDSTASTVAYISFYDKNDNPFGSIALIRQPATGNYFAINPRDESGVAMTQPFVVGRGSAGDLCGFPMATTPPSTMSTARTNLISAVVANYHNGNSWYIKFSDGFIMQGGSGAGGDSLNGKQLTFLTPFITANYNFQATIYTTTTASTFVRARERATNSIYVATGYLSGSTVTFTPYAFDWVAMGY